jgi:hypothetical protein
VLLVETPLSHTHTPHFQCHIELSVTVGEAETHHTPLHCSVTSEVSVTDGVAGWIILHFSHFPAA